MSHHLNRTRPCTKSGCNARRFMDSERCFDHQSAPVLVKAWVAFCVLLCLAMLGLGAWAVIELVQWVTAQ